MKKKASFEGFLYEDKTSSRKPIYLIEDTKGYPKVTLERKISESGIVPSTIAERDAKWNKTPVDFIGEGEGRYGFNVRKQSVLDNVKKVKVTVIVEEL